MTGGALTIRSYGHDDAAELRTLLLDVHDDCYADQMDDLFHTRARFEWFVDHWSSNPGWSCVIGYDATDPVGFAYGAPLAPQSEWWRGHLDPEPEHQTTFGLSELMVRPKWRKTGTSGHLHDALLKDRTEHLVVLSVDREHRKVQSLYESWGYEKVGQDKPFDDSPTFAVMLRSLRWKTT